MNDSCKVPLVTSSSLLSQVLLKKFEDFTAEVSALGQSKLEAVLQLGQEVRSPEGQDREAELLQLWEGLKQAIETRGKVRKIAFPMNLYRDLQCSV